MKVIIAGSRDFTNHKFLFRVMDEFAAFFDGEKLQVVSGTARGVDKLGERWGESRGHKVIRFKPQWEKYGRSAGHIRNRKMAIAASKGWLVAFWNGEKEHSGTYNMIETAEECGLKIKIVRI